MQNCGHSVWKGHHVPSKLGCWCLKLDSNQRPCPYEGLALPTELLRHLGCTAELESATSGATIRCSNHLSYVHMVLPAGIEPSFPGVKDR